MYIHPPGCACGHAFAIRGVDVVDDHLIFFGQSLGTPPNPLPVVTMMEILNRMKSLSVVYPCRMATVLRAANRTALRSLRGRGSDDLTPL
jgi:hypothetical protein